MNEREIFLAAIEIGDPAERNAYLDRACSQDPQLRQRLDDLLKSHDVSSQFLETPASASESAIDRTLISGPDDTEDEDSDPQGLSTVAQFRQYLEPSTRPGWLGRLAHYEIEEILGRGAFGIVAKAFDEKLHRVVAIKMMSPELASTSPPRKRFLREARTAAAVTHENIVAIYAVEEEPIPYLVMEYIPGQTLQQRLDDQGPFDLADVLRIGRQIASGLAAAQTANMIHRDIKPANILLTSGVNERAKLSDFGLARAVDDASLTTSGLIAGTPMYMSPEQARGEPLDHRSDLFSLGSVLYQMASGRPPFRAANAIAVLKRVCEDQPRPLDDVIPETPAWLETIIFQLMEKDRDDRFQTAQEVAELLERCERELAHNGKVTCVMASPGLLPTRQMKPLGNKAIPPRTKTSRSWTRGWLIGGAVALVIGAIVYLNAPGPKAWPRGAWDAADHNQDGQVTREEMELFGSQAAHRNVPRLLWHFESADTNHDGTVDHDEIEAYGYAVGSLDPNDHLPPSATARSVEGATAGSFSSDKPGWHGWPSDAPSPAIAPFDAEQAQKHQEEWAKYLGVPVEYENSIGMKFRLIPPGEFLMGSTPEEIERYLRLRDSPNANTNWQKNWRDAISSEGPQQPTVITQPFYLAMFEVTQADFKKVMGTNPASYQPEGKAKELVAGMDTSRFPIEMVSWNEAIEFCIRLSQIENLSAQYFATESQVTPLPGKGYLLPTEAQWEFACRAGTTTIVWSGNHNSALSSISWNSKNSGRRPHVVGELPSNPFKLHDMLGNVEEFCADGTSDKNQYRNYSTSVAVDPQVPWVDTPLRIVRGGDFQYEVECCRSAFRNRNFPTLKAGSLGFRVSLPVETVKKAMAPRPDPDSATIQKWHGWPADAPAPAIAPFNAEQAKKHQEEWAKYLGVPVEKEISLGRNRLGQDVKLNLVLIPPGEFLMGTSQEEIDRLREQAPALGLKVEDVGRINLEGPQHPVQITRPFYLSRNEFTTDQFRSFVQAQPGEYQTEAEASGKGAWAPKVGVAERDPELNWRRAGRLPQGPDSPVVNVTWNDANDCCKWLSQQDADLTFALPTEAQWEYACRAGTTTLWSTGNEQSSLEGYAVFKANWPKNIGDRLPNAFGLCDMHGNVWEWCQDAFYDYRDAGSIDPLGKVNGEFRIIRGGSCYDGSGISRSWQENSGCRSAVRDVRKPDNPLLQIGFRVAAKISDDVSQAAIARKKSTSQVQWPADAPAPAIAPFDAEQAKKHQEEWAAYLKVPVEYTNSIGMKFRLIPPGEFLMGSTPEEIEAALPIAGDDQTWQDCIRSEGPRHKVILTQPFYLGTHEVTQSQFQRIMKTNPSRFSQSGEWVDSVKGLDTASFPVETVEWEAAQEFCQQLIQQEGLQPNATTTNGVRFPFGADPYRLPVEAEWEFACRAGSTTQFFSGETSADLTKVGWFDDNSLERTHQTGELPANGLGLHDMHGNVWEWVLDDWLSDSYTARAAQPTINPIGPQTKNSEHMSRGGNWVSYAEACRSASRSSASSAYDSSLIGFRVVFTTEAVKQLLDNRSKPGT